MNGQLMLVFDDGYEEERTTIGPLIREREVPACFAITPEYLGSDGYLTVPKLAEFVDSGCEVIAHGRAHRFLQAHHLAVDVPGGAEEVPLASGHVFPGEEHGVLPGDEIELADGTHSETCVVSEIGGSTDSPTIRFETPLEASYAAGEAILRPTRNQLRDEIVGAKIDLQDLGFDPRAFAFPYDAADVRAWQLARSEYDALVNTSPRSLPNPAGTPLTELRRFYLETDALTRREIADYLDAVGETDGLGILAGHSSWETATTERVSFVVDAARDRGIEITTVSDVLDATEGGTV